MASRAFAIAQRSGAVGGHGERADVLEVEPNYLLHTTAVPNDPFFSSMWGLSNSSHLNADIHAVTAWNVTISGDT